MWSIQLLELEHLQVVCLFVFLKNKKKNSNFHLNFKNSNFNLNTIFQYYFQFHLQHFIILQSQQVQFILPK